MKTWTYTKTLQRRAEREGWGIFNGREVQRLDEDDAQRGFILSDDREATQRAHQAGVPVDLKTGYLTCDRLVTR